MMNLILDEEMCQGVRRQSPANINTKHYTLEITCMERGLG